LNNLLQGRIVTEVDLMMHARRLDEAEREVMGEMGTETFDYLKFMAVNNIESADCFLITDPYSQCVIVTGRFRKCFR
jgi:hypothetical protein